MERAGHGHNLSAVAIADRAVGGDQRTMGVAGHFAVHKVVFYTNQVAFASGQRLAYVVWGAAARLEVRSLHPFLWCFDV